MMRRKRGRKNYSWNGDTFITLHHWMVRTPAFKSLSGNAVKLVVVLAGKYDGHNNGAIFLSVRQAADEVGCSNNHAVKLFRELQEKGFIAIVQRGAFSLKSRHASTWRLTWLPMRRTDDPRLMHEGTKEFMRWSPSSLAVEKQNAVA